MQLTIRVLSFVGALLLTAVAAGQTETPKLDPGNIARIEEALPDEAFAAPAAPRKLLIFTRCTGYFHEVIPLAAETLRMLGAKTMAFEGFVSDDPAQFDPRTLAQYDGVIMVNTSGDPIDTPERRQALLDFVEGGKGFMGLHAATGCHYDWAAYGELIGAYFVSHPWNAGDTVTVKIDDPLHPIAAPFEGKSFEIKEEIYQFRDPYSREDLRVLASLDTARTDMNKKGIQREDGDFAISWVKRYGKGRVFYSSFGHNDHIFWNRAILRHLLAGIQFALGDLDADATPSASLSEEYRCKAQAAAAAASINQAIAALPSWEHGDDPAPLNLLASAVRDSQGNPAWRQELAHQISEVLEVPGVTPAAVDFVCRQMRQIGGEDQVSEIERVLYDPETADMARYALERMPGRKPAIALRKALRRTEGRVRQGMIASVGARRDEEAVRILRRLDDEDDATVRAVLEALGAIGAPKADETLAEWDTADQPGLEAARGEARLRGAQRMFADGNTAAAAVVYEALIGTGNPPEIRAGALLGLTAVRQAGALPLILASLEAEEAPLRQGAAEAARRVEGKGTTEALCQALPDRSPSAQVALVYALGDREDAAAQPTIEALLRETEEPALRRAAVYALGKAGGATAVAQLAPATADADAEVARLAREALETMDAPYVDHALVAAAGMEKPQVRTALIEILTVRHAQAARPVLVQALADPEPTVRRAAYDALAVLAEPSDIELVTLRYIGEEDAQARAAGETALVALLERGWPRGQRVTVLTTHFPLQTQQQEAWGGLLRMLAELGEPAGLELVRSALRSRSAGLRDRAIESLAAWPNPAPLHDLYSLAAGGPPRDLRTTALRGYFRLLALPSDRPPAETVRLYQRGLTLAEDRETRRQALLGLAEVAHPGIGAVAAPFAGDPELEPLVQRIAERAAAMNREAS